MKRALLSLMGTFVFLHCFSQTSLPLNTIVSENFNSIGGSATVSLPANWKMSSAGTGLTSGWTTGTNVTATSQAANSGLPATSGAYNWATTAGTDRAIGFLPTLSSSTAIMAYYRNTTGGSVSSVTIAYALERYVINTAPPTIDIYYSTNGTAWTLINGASVTATEFPSGAAAGSFSAPKTINKTINVNVSLASNADIYFKWVFSTGNTVAQGIGLDNVSVFAGTATPVVIATLRDSLLVDNGAPNQYNEGDVIRYKAVIKNTGTGDANNIQVALPAPPVNTTMVGGSIKTSAVAVDDNYAASFNTALVVGAGQGVLINDVGIPAPTAVVSYGTTADATLFAPGSAGSTDAGGSITLNANGTFTYTPPSGFSGIDKFKYITGNGNLPNNDAIVTITVGGDISFSTTNVDPTCNGGSNGSITFNASGGNGALQYSITGAAGTYQTSNVFSGLNAGTYNLAVKDAGGYIKTGTATLNNPLAVVVNGGTPVTITYNTAMATVSYTRTNGTGASTWSATGLPAGVSINASTGDVTGTPSVTGVFNATINVSDVNGCTGSKSITINAAPKLANDSYSAVGNTQLVADGQSSPTTPFTSSATNILGNDASNAAITVTAVTNAATTGGGIITIGADGKFTYSPPIGSTAADSYTYTATSNGVSATATINFTIANMIWYVNNTYGGANGAANGSSARPYTDLTAASSAAQANQYIYVHTGSGNTTGNATLKSGQILRGAGTALSVGALSLGAGVKPTLSGTVILANSVAVDGFDMNTATLNAITNAGNTVTGVNVTIGSVATTTGAGISITGTGNSVTITLASLTTNGAANAVNLINTGGTVTINGGTLTGGAGAVVNVSGGTVSFTYSGSASQATAAQPLVNAGGGHTTGTILFQTGTLSATNGTGLQFDNSDGTYTFSGTTTLNGGDAGIDILNGSAGTFSFSNSTAITNPSGTVITVNSSSANVTYSGTFSKTNAGTGILINGETGGTITVNGTGTKTLSTSTGNAISLTANTGAAINFSGNNLLLTTTSGIAFNATGGGTLSVQGTGNIISSITGIGINIVNTTIGNNDITFQSISVNGASSGIVLNTTGTLGELNVTGVAVAGSGGSLQNTTSHAVIFNSTKTPVLNLVNISNTGGDAINAASLTAGFTVTSCQITNAGDGDNENGLTLVNVGGTVSVQGTSINNVAEEFIEVSSNNNSNLTLNVGTVSACTFTLPNTLAAIRAGGAFAGNGVLVTASGSSNYTINISNCTFTDIKLFGFQFGSTQTGSASASTGNNCNINLINNQFQVTVINALGNSNNRANTINIQGAGTIDIDALISNNTLNKGGGGGIQIGADNNCNINAEVRNNTVSNQFADGMLMAVDENASLTVLIDGNQISNVSSDGMEIANNISPGGTSILNATITNNTVNGHNNNTGGNSFFGGICVFGGADASDVTFVNITGNSVSGNPSPGVYFDYTVDGSSFGDAITVQGAGTGAVSEADFLAAPPPQNTTTAPASGRTYIGNAFYSNNVTVPLPVLTP